jgi:hypothetical protein
MAMPKDLVFVRHGLSEANIVQKADKAGAAHENHQIVFGTPKLRKSGLMPTLAVQEALISGISRRF